MTDHQLFTRAAKRQLRRAGFVRNREKSRLTRYWIYEKTLADRIVSVTIWADSKMACSVQHRNLRGLYSLTNPTYFHSDSELYYALQIESTRQDSEYRI